MKHRGRWSTIYILGLFAGWCWCWFRLVGASFFVRGKHCWLAGLSWLKPTNEHADYIIFNGHVLVVQLFFSRPL